MDTHREQELRDVPLRKVDRSKWPRGVRPIAIDEMDAMGIDADGRVYWNGTPIQVSEKISLRTFELSIAVIVAVAAAVQALVALMPSLPSLFEKLVGITS